MHFVLVSGEFKSSYLQILFIYLKSINYIPSNAPYSWGNFALFYLWDDVSYK